MHSALVRHVIFPMHERLRGRKTLAYLAELEQNQWLSRGALEALQWKKLKRLLEHASRTVPYYARLFKTLGASPEDIRTPLDFQQLPVLTRDIIRDNIDSLKSRSRSVRFLKNSTGGSSGQPLRFYTDTTKETLGNAGKLRSRRWWGLEIGDSELDIWGHPVELSRMGRARDWKDRLLNLRAVSAYDLSHSSLLRWIEILKRHRPRFLYVYPSALVYFCQFLKKERINLRPWAPQYVISTAETLFPLDRALVEE